MPMSAEREDASTGTTPTELAMSGSRRLVWSIV